MGGMSDELRKGALLQLDDIDGHGVCAGADRQVGTAHRPDPQGALQEDPAQGRR